VVTNILEDKMLDEGLPPVLADIGNDGRLRPGSTLRARP